VTIPATVIATPNVSDAASGLSTRAARRIAATAIGTLTTKIHCQEALSTIRPPMIGPKIGPSRIGTPTAASARPTRRGPALCANQSKADRHQHPAAEALKDPERDQLTGRGRQRAQARANRE
jgi:hypothetical protein